MSVYDSGQSNSLAHSGTFNANEVSLTAGMATLECYGRNEIDRINQLGVYLRYGLNNAFKITGIVGQATGMGSLATLHWRDGEIKTAHDAAVGVSRSADLNKLLHLEMINPGNLFTTPGTISAFDCPD